MSSEAVRSEEYYFRLLLETDKKQAKLLLTNPNSGQLSALSEIAYNLISLVLPKQAQKLVKKLKTFLTKISKKATSIRAKIGLLKKHWKALLDVLKSVKDEILMLI